MEEILAAELQDGESFVLGIVASPNGVTVLPVGRGHDLAHGQVLPLRARGVVRSIAQRGLAELAQQRLELDGIPAAQVEDDV